MPETDSTDTSDQTTDAQPETGEAEVDWKAKAREWEKRAKQNHAQLQELLPKAQQFDALEAASKSDLQRAQEQIAALQQQAANNERQALIVSVALEKGLPASLARRLQGESRDDLEADADELLSQFQANQSTEPRAPRADPSQGSSANGRTAASDPAQQFASVIRSQLGS